MFQTIKAFLSSVIVHIVLLSGLLITFNFDSGRAVLPEPVSNHLSEPVIAEALDLQMVEEEVARLQAQDDQKRQQEKDRQAKLQAEAEAAKQKRKKEEQRLAVLEEQRIIKEKEQAKLEQQRKAEEANLKELAIQKKKQAAEKAKIEADNKRLAEEKAELEAQRAEAERKQKAAEAAKTKAVAERKANDAAAKKREEELARKKALESELAAAIAAEENSGEQARDREIYRGLIAQAVQRQWVRPASVQVAECVLRVTQIPGGEVVRVTPVAGRCGGDDLFKRSVTQAVEAASPLPAPPNPDVFEREIEFLFRPE